MFADVKTTIVRRNVIEQISLGPIAIIALHLLIVANPVCGKGIVSVEAAINRVAEHERRIKIAEWDAAVVSGHVDDPLKPKNIRSTQDPRVYSKSHVIYEPATGRFRVDTEAVLGASAGTGQVVATYRTETFDGHIRRLFVHSRDGDRLPDNENYKDKVGRVQIPGQMKPKEWSLPPGVGHFPPNFLGIRFSVFLRERLQKNLPLRVSETPGGTWQFETLADDHAETGCETRIEYDPTRGIVLNAEWWVTSNSDFVKRFGKLWMRIVILWNEISPGLWVPQSVIGVNAWDKSANRVDYSNARVNFKADEAVYRLQFPDGTEVVDDTERKVYRMSPDGFDDRAAREQYDRRQNPFDDARRRYSFEVGTRILRKVAVVMAVLVVVICTGIIWRKRRRARSQVHVPE